MNSAPASRHDIAINVEGLSKSFGGREVVQTGWVIEGTKGAARMLNLHPNTLRSRIKKLGIKRHEIP